MTVLASVVASGELSADGLTLTVTVPLSFRCRGSRKQVVTTPGEKPTCQPKIVGTIAKALARAFRWRKLLETGAYATIEEIAAVEKINSSYVSRVLRLTLLAPEIVEALLGGQAPEIGLADLFKPFAVEWTAQKSALLS